MTAMVRLAALAIIAASPAVAATGPFISLGNTNFIVLLAFILFVGVLLYARVPGKLTGLLDARAEQIKGELNEARALREEAKGILATYEKKRKEVQEQADLIVSAARTDAIEAAEAAKADLKRSIARRLAAAEDRIASAEKDAVRAVRERAVTVAIEVAGEMLARQRTPGAAGAAIDAAIAEVDAKLH